MTEPVPIDGRSLSLDRFLAVARGGAPVALAPAARDAIARSRRTVEQVVASGRPVYGITTGFGAFSDRVIPPADGRELQIALVRSHASGTGPPLAPEVVRGTMLLRLNSLARGLSGVRVELVERLVDVLNRGLTPWVPEQGSVGASGDLAPLAHIALALTGEGAFLDPAPPGAAVPAAEALARAGVAPLSLEAKEGVALLNGTSLMGAYLALGVADARALLDAAIVAAAVAFDALEGSPEALDDRLGEIRGSPDHREVARALRALLAGSGLSVARHGWTGQDPYTLRCLPQVLGAARLGIGNADRLLDAELNAVSDNPIVFGDEFVHGGNFHGQPLAFALDSLALAVQYVAGFSERRTSRLIHPALNRGLPAFLAPTPGLSSGFMVPQYVAAALVTENATLVHPASATSLPTSADQEDYVSMGAWAGAKLARVLANARRVVAIEWIVAAAALEHRRPKEGGGGSRAAVRALRRRVEPWTRDRSPSRDIEGVAEAIASGALVAEVRADVAF